MSISPHEDHSLLIPKVQMAGHDPVVVSMRARISKRPKIHDFLPEVFMLAEV